MAARASRLHPSPPHSNGNELERVRAALDSWRVALPGSAMTSADVDRGADQVAGRHQREADAP